MTRRARRIILFAVIGGALSWPFFLEGNKDDKERQGSPTVQDRTDDEELTRVIKGALKGQREKMMRDEKGHGDVFPEIEPLDKEPPKKDER